MATVKIGMDSAGTMEATITGTTVSDTFDTDSGMSMALEGINPLNANVDFGFGIEFQTYRALSKSTTGGEFQFVPIYMVARVHPEMSGLTPYLTMQLGFALFNADNKFASGLDTSPGTHFGFGVGVILDKEFVIEFMMTEDTGGLTYGNEQVIDVSYSKATFSIGMAF